MSVFLSKDEDLKKSNLYIGYLILKKLKDSKKSRVSVYDVYDYLNKNNINSYRQILFGLLFLYSSDLIVFQYPYIEIINDKA